MKKTVLSVGLFASLLFSILSMATEAPSVSYVEAQSETVAQGKLYDADLTDVHTTPHGMCYEFSAYDRRDIQKLTIIYGHICGNKIVRY